MQKRDLNYLAGILLIFIFIWMSVTGLIQLRFELHRFIYHIYGVYILIILAVVHIITNWNKISGFIRDKVSFRKEKIRDLQKNDILNILSIALVFSLTFTLASGFLQVKLNLPQSRFSYHIYSAYITLSLALIHFCLNLKKINTYLKSKSPAIFLNPSRKTWKPSFKSVSVFAAGLVVVTTIVLAINWLLPREQIGMRSPSKRLVQIDLDMAMKYHEETKHTYAELMTRKGRLDWAKQPPVFKEYPQREFVRLSTDTDFNSISVEEAIEKGSYMGGFSGGAITKLELSRLLYYTNGVTGVLRYPNLTYYLRAAPSAGALYPTVIYLVVNNVEGLKKGIYHYSVKDHGLYFLKEGDFIEELASLVTNPSLIKNSSVVFIMSAIFYRTKWKYRERGYRYVLLDTGHIAENLTLVARALDLGSHSVVTFLDSKVNKMLDIDGLKEAAIYISAVGTKGSLDIKKSLKSSFSSVYRKEPIKKSLTGFMISELLHESGKLESLVEPYGKSYKGNEVSYKSYLEAKKVYLPKEFSKQGMSLDDAIRKRRSARDYSDKPISKLELSRLLYYTSAPSIESIYPIEIYIVVNNVTGIAKGIYHYSTSEHAIELLKQGDYSFRIANACLGQQLVGNANIAIIKTALFERIKSYGDREYRYIHLDAGAIGENIYLEAVSMGLGVCGIGAFFDDQINEILGIDGVKESVIYVTSVGRVS